MPNNLLKDVHCSNKRCGAVLCQTDGARLIAPNPIIFSKKLSQVKKSFNPLYCEKCHRITRFYKVKQNFACLRKPFETAGFSSDKLLDIRNKNSNKTNVF